MRGGLKLLLMLLLSVLATSFVSCQKGPETETVYRLEASSVTLNFAAENADVRTVTVTAENVNWEVHKNDESDTWYTISTGGNEVYVEVDDNPDAEPRSAKFTVTSDVASVAAVEITVKQAGVEGGGDDELPGLSPATLVFEAIAGEQTVGVTSSEWSATVDADWVTITPSSGVDGTITVSVTANETAWIRTATITVTNAVGPEYISVEQKRPAVPATDPWVLWYAYSAETKNVTVESMPGWTITSNAAWLTVTKTSERVFTAAATTNGGEERTAVITLTNAFGSQDVLVTQASPAGVPFRIATAAFGGTQFGYDTGYFTVSLYSGESMWEATHYGYIMDIDIVAPLPAYDGTYLDIAPGTYNLTSSPGPYTVLIDPAATFTILKYESYPEYRIVSSIYPTGGTVTVEGNHDAYRMTFDLDLPEGRKFKADYEGSLPVERNGWVPPAHNEPFDAGNVTGAVMDIALLGRNGQFPVHVWDVDVCSPTVRKKNDTWEGDGYVFCTRFGSSIETDTSYLPDYTYGVHGNNEFIGSALQGFDDLGYDEGTWMYRLEGGVITQRIAVLRGVITSTHSGNTYTFTVNGIDATGAPVKGVFTGVATVRN